MKTVFTLEALEDLQRIGDHIAEDNPRRAGLFVDQLVNAASEIALSPMAYPLVPRYADLGIRRRVYGRYLLFYRAEPNQVTLIHVLHGARDYDALLFPDA